MKKRLHNPAKFYPSAHSIRAAHKADGRTVSAWMKRPDFPKFVKGAGYPVEDVDAAVLKIRASQAGTITGANADLRREKLSKEIERLVEDVRMRRLEADKAAGLMVSIDEVRGTLFEMAAWIKDTLTMFVSGVTVLTGDARLVAEAERLRDRCLARMQELVRA